MSALLDATNGPPQSLVGTRIRDDNDFRGTIRYVGPVATSTKDPNATWYGIEWDDNTRGASPASRCVEAPSRHRCASSPGMMDVGGFFFDFEAIRTESSDRDAPRRCCRAARRLLAGRESSMREVQLFDGR